MIERDELTEIDRAGAGADRRGGPGGEGGAGPDPADVLTDVYVSY